jgi:transposase
MSDSSNQKSEAVKRRREVRRRMRSVEEKRQIAEASLQPGASVAEVAQAYGVHPSQVGKWRRLYRNGLIGNSSEPALLAVHIAEDVQPRGISRTAKPQRSRAGIIHVEFARARVSIEGTADPATLRAVLECLAG